MLHLFEQGDFRVKSLVLVLKEPSNNEQPRTSTNTRPPLHPQYY